MTPERANQIRGEVWGHRIRASRVNQCLTQQELAEAVARITGSTLHRTAVAHWEAGTHLPSFRHRRAIAGALGVAREVLFEEPAQVATATIEDAA